MNHHPLRLVYLLQPNTILPNHQVLFSIPKKKVRKAVDRNRIRRQMREAYRLHKHLLPPKSTSTHHFLLAFIYSGNPGEVGYDGLCSSIVTILKGVSSRYARYTSKKPSHTS